MQWLVSLVAAVVRSPAVRAAARALVAAVFAAVLAWAGAPAPVAAAAGGLLGVRKRFGS